MMGDPGFLARLVVVTIYALTLVGLLRLPAHLTSGGPGHSERGVRWWAAAVLTAQITIYWWWG